MKLRQWQAESITQAFEQYRSGKSHFLCLATPGAGKTLMASQLSKRLFDSDMIDLVICFSPSIVVASDFREELEIHTEKRFDGALGSAGTSLTYQGMLSLSSDFWSLLSQYRVFVIFDEIHHCAGLDPVTANAWGQRIMSSIQGKAAYTLALTGTPWRSDSIPIVLSHYCDKSKHIQCDYSYGLKEAISDDVCRTPKLMVIDNEEISFKQGEDINSYSSFSDLLTNTEFKYQSLIENEAVIEYLLNQADKKLNQLRNKSHDAGGLIVATSVAHARQILHILKNSLGEEAAIATYQEDDAPSIIQEFKYGRRKWIISVGMISEGTNIPRLMVCCHLTRVKTELHFRQVLGRILRSNGTKNEEGYCFIPAEPRLIEYAHRVGDDIPSEITVKFDSMPTFTLNDNQDNIEFPSDTQEPSINSHESENETNHISIHTNNNNSVLSESYNSSINIFGRFKTEVLSLSGSG